VLDSAAEQRAAIGERVRQARTLAHLSQGELGARIGYSGSVISRIESGHRVVDPPTLIAIAQATATPPQHFGLLPPEDTTRQVALPAPQPLATLIHDPWKAGGVVRRRDFILTAMAVTAGDGETASSGRLARPSVGSGGAQELVADLDRALFHPAPPDSPPAHAYLQRALAAAQQDFRAARYGTLGTRLPRLIAVTRAARDGAHDAARERAEALMAHTFALASDWCAKQNQDALAWVTADRALSAAHQSGQPAALGEAARTLAIAMRRSGHHAPATALLEQTAAALDADHGDPPAARLRVFGALKLTAAYTAALGGARTQARDLLAEAEEAAGRIACADESGGGLYSDCFGPSQLGLYGVSVHHALGEHAQALRYARGVRIEDVPTAERQARFFVDVARAQHALGNATGAYHALLAAEGRAPEDVRRPSVRALTADLLYTPRSAGAPAGLRSFAERTGALM